MKDEYDIEKLNPRKNPYSKRLKKQVTIHIDNDTIDFLKRKTKIPAYHIRPLSIDIFPIARNKKSNYKCLGTNCELPIIKRRSCREMIPIHFPAAHAASTYCKIPASALTENI